uniref:Secreted protein n=1 Tax=Panstrongylus lignarius TaxID=156445 RepID=A0A224XUG6_9HEMI
MRNGGHFVARLVGVCLIQEALSQFMQNFIKKRVMLRGRYFLVLFVKKCFQARVIWHCIQEFTLEKPTLPCLLILEDQVHKLNYTVVTYAVNHIQWLSIYGGM